MPNPPTKYAFFDFDGTILRSRSFLEFEEHYARYTGLSTEQATKHKQFVSRALRHAPTRRIANLLLMHLYGGRQVTDVVDCAERWARMMVSKKDSFCLSTLKLVASLTRDEFHIVVVSGSPTVILRPLARRLGISDVIGGQIEIKNGRFTGRLQQLQTIGEGKANAVKKYLAAHRGRPELSVACGDHTSDIPMLASVGTAYVVPGSEHLEAEAARRGWHVLNVPKERS